MRNTVKLALVLTVCGLAVALANPVAASTRLQKLAENRYLITHQKQSSFAGQGKALRMAHEKAASLCLVLGYSWFEVRDTQSQGRGFGHNPGATLEVKFYKDEAVEDLNKCEALASEEQRQKMSEALSKMKGGS